jgi:hypothetical protein
MKERIKLSVVRGRSLIDYVDQSLGSARALSTRVVCMLRPQCVSAPSVRFTTSRNVLKL